MAFGYPIFLELAGRHIVVIGAGAVREGKVEGLLAAGATDVLVVSTGPAAHLDELSAVDGVTVLRRRWRTTDLEGAFLCVAADADPAESTVAVECGASVISSVPSSVLATWRITFATPWPTSAAAQWTSALPSAARRTRAAV